MLGKGKRGDRIWDKTLLWGQGQRLDTLGNPKCPLLGTLGMLFLTGLLCPVGSFCLPLAEYFKSTPHQTLDPGSGSRGLEEHAWPSLSPSS